MDNIVTGLKALAGSVEGKPVYFSAGNLYSFDDSGDLSKEDDHPAAEPYLWPIAHNVRPAAQSLGARRCEDCHSPGAPFFFGRIAVDTPVENRAGSFIEMNQMHEASGPTHGGINKFFKYMIITVMTLLIFHIMGDLFRRFMSKKSAK
jgi:hypothetical protein